MESENYWLAAWKKYGDFSGRATRSEFWIFQIEVFVFVLLGFFVISILPKDLSPNLGAIVVMLGLIFILGIIIPSYAVTVRRLHDSGKSGWFLLVGFIPYIGHVTFLIFMLLGSFPGENEYGEDPKK